MNNLLSQLSQPAQSVVAYQQNFPDPEDFANIGGIMSHGELLNALYCFAFWMNVITGLEQKQSG